MVRQTELKLWGACLFVSLAITGCRSAVFAPPPQPQPVGSLATATPFPTVSLPTAKPPTTPAPPTPTSTLTIKPSATPTPVPTPVSALVYVVQETDTLSGIAQQFNTTTEVLAAINGLNQTDFIQVGQTLIIQTPEEARSSIPATEEAEVVVEAPPAVQAPATSSTQVETNLYDPETKVTLATQAPALASTEINIAPVAPPLLPPPPPTLLPPAPVSPPAPVAIYSGNINPLTGLPVSDPATLQRRPLLVRVGNDVGARQSQAGLNSADMVYEEVAEWWVTRFTAIFLSKTPKLVAPVRSARLINVQLAPQYQGALAHSGGSDPVRWEISQAPIVNLDEFYNPPPYFYRPNAGWQTRLAIDTEAARSYLIAKGLEAPVKLAGFFFGETLELGEPAPNIYIPYPGSTSFTQWRYDPASGKYLRWISGNPLYDFTDGQIAASNVVIYFADHQATDIVEDANGATSIRIIVNGRGPAWFFRDGKLNRGFWQTNGAQPPYFTYENGSPYPLKPGNSWVEVVPPYFRIGLNSANEASSGP